MGGFGRIIGAVVGGILGYLIPGVGFAIGFAIGGLIGGIVDPGGRVSSPGVPRQQLQITTNEIGIPIPDLVGTGKITGIFLAYGKERSKKQYAKSGGKGFGGGSKKQVTGYKYYMSWVQAICLGPVDTLYAIYQDNDTLLWEGELNCPVSGGKETIVIKKFGSVDFYFGTTDHALNTKIGALLDDPTLNTPWRGLCYAFMDDCYIGTYNRCPSLHFVIRKAPVISSLPAGTIQTYDYNPINTLWYILNKLTRLPETWLHAADFTTASVTINNEHRGISMLFDQFQSALNYLQTINDHIYNIIQYGNDGKFHPKLIRNDYSIPALPLVDEDVFLEDPTFSRKAWIDTVNEVKVQYSEITNISRPSIGGPLEVCGEGEYGQLAQNDFLDRDVFTSIGSDLWASASIFSHLLAIGEDGSLWGAGYNSNGQLGLNDTDNKKILTQVPSMSNCYQVACGGYHSILLKNDTTLWTCGSNYSGALGLGDTVERHVFTQVTPAPLLIAFICGGRGSGSSWVITMGYELYCSGGTTAGYGQMGGFAGTSFIRCIPTTIVGEETVEWPYWKYVSAGYYGTVLINLDGSLWHSGTNDLGFTPSTTFIQNVAAGGGWKSVAHGKYHTMGIKDDGTLWAVGHNEDGQLGLGHYTSQTSFVQVGSDDDWVYVEVGFPASVLGGHSVAMKSDGTVWTTGTNTSGQLGLNDTTKRNVFTKVDSVVAIGIAAGFSNSLRIREE